MKGGPPSERGRGSPKGAPSLKGSSLFNRSFSIIERFPIFQFSVRIVNNHRISQLPLKRRDFIWSTHSARLPVSKVVIRFYWMSAPHEAIYFYLLQKPNFNVPQDELIHRFLLKRGFIGAFSCVEHIWTPTPVRKRLKLKSQSKWSEWANLFNGFP